MLVDFSEKRIHVYRQYTVYTRKNPHRDGDFYGAGDSGTGRIGGYSIQPKNLVYAKKIGIDILVKDESLFSFDLQVSSKYKVDSPSQTAISPAKNSKLSSSQTSAINKIF